MNTHRNPALLARLSFLSLLALLLFSACCRNSHFITDAAYRQQVLSDYSARMDQFPSVASQLAFMDTLAPAEREAMQFLYAYMLSLIHI